jgi:hypothetical protein
LHHIFVRNRLAAFTAWDRGYPFDDESEKVESNAQPIAPKVRSALLPSSLRVRNFSRSQWFGSTSLRLMNRGTRCLRPCGGNAHETIAELHESYAVLFSPLFSRQAWAG